MEIVALWLFLSIIAAVIAANKGRSGLGFFLLSIVLSPLIGIIAALVAREDRDKVEEKKISSGADKKRPFCAEVIKREAVVCRYCGRDLVDGENQAKESELVGKLDDTQLMQKYGVTYSDGKYHYNEYRYDRLEDAIDYAKKQA